MVSQMCTTMSDVIFYSLTLQELNTALLKCCENIQEIFYFLLLPYPLSVLNIVHIAIAIDIYRVSCFIVLYSPWISNLNRPKIYLVWRFLFSFPMIGINQFFPPLWKFWNKAMCNDAVRQFQEFSFIRLYTTVNDCHDL